MFLKVRQFLPLLREKLRKVFIRWVKSFVLIGVGAAAGYLGANHWRMPTDQGEVLTTLMNQKVQLLNTLGVMNQKLDLIWGQTSAIAKASHNAGVESGVTELPAIKLNGGLITLRFKQIGEQYHYECTLAGGIDAIARLIAPNGKSALLKATFSDKDNFDVTDLTLAGQDFAITEGEGGKDVALNKQGVWENKVDPGTIKNWRVDVMMDQDTENKTGVSTVPSAQIQNLAADITVHPTTGQLLLPASLQEIQDKIAQATPAPTPQASTPTFQDPPKALPTPAPSPDKSEESQVR